MDLTSVIEVTKVPMVKASLVTMVGVIVPKPIWPILPPHCAASIVDWSKLQENISFESADLSTLINKI